MTRGRPRHQVNKAAAAAAAAAGEMKLRIDASDSDAPVDGDSGAGAESQRPSSARSNRRHHTEESCMKQMLYCLLSNQAFRQKRTRQALIKGNTINSVSKIDRLSRVLFPLTFFLLNAFYWWGYVTKDDHFTWAHLDAFKFY